MSSTRQYISIAAAVVSFLPALAHATAPVTTKAPSAATAPVAKPANNSRTALWSRLQDQFRTLDTNKDGSVSQAEMAAGLSAEQQKISEVMRQRRLAAFTAMDKNNDGQLSRDEFLAAGPQAKAGNPDGSKAMGRLDANKDGKLTLSEYSSPALANFDRLDLNRDGVVSADEAKKAAPKR